MTPSDPSTVFASVFYGSMQLSCEGRTIDELEAAMTLIAKAQGVGLFGSGRLTWRRDGAGIPALVCEVESLHGYALLLLSNIMSAENRTPALLHLQGIHQSARIPVVSRLYKAPMPATQVECDLQEITDVLDNFVLLFEFGRALDTLQREQFCEAVDVWADLVSAGAFPIEEKLASPSVIGGYSCRFEDPTVGGVYAEGMAASPACFGLLVNLANRWQPSVGVRRMALEQMH